MKVCTKCKQERDETEYYTDNKQGIRPWCKKCEKLKKDKYKQQNSHHMKQYNSTYYNNNSDRLREQSKQYYNDNKELHHKNVIRRRKERKQVDPLFKLQEQIRLCIDKTLKKHGYTKRSKTRELLGCSYEDFMMHLGPKPDGNIDKDHICPCSQAQNEEELIKLQHYSNWRWLDHEENMRKSDNKTAEAEEMCRRLLGREWID